MLLPDTADLGESESTDGNVTGRDGGLPERSAGVAASRGGPGGEPEPGAVAQRGSGRWGRWGRGREGAACAGTLARPLEPGRRYERASGRERDRP